MVIASPDQILSGDKMEEDMGGTCNRHKIFRHKLQDDFKMDTAERG